MRALLCLPLVACASDPAPRWVGSGNLAVDQGQCQAQAFSVPGASALQIGLVFNACMRGKGWTLIQ